MDYEDNERIIRMHRKKYGPPNAARPERGSNLPFFWIGYAVVFAGLALVLGKLAGG